MTHPTRGAFHTEPPTRPSVSKLKSAGFAARMSRASCRASRGMRGDHFMIKLQRDRLPPCERRSGRRAVASG